MEQVNTGVSGSAFADILQRELITGETATAGLRLPSERELARRFGVSRPLVREALRALAGRGLVVSQPGRGTFIRDVRPLDVARPMDELLRRQRSTARHLLTARSVLEAEAAALAAARADEAIVAQLQSLLVATEENSQDILAKVRADLQFHAGVVRAAGNPIIETMFAAIVRPIGELMLRSRSDSNLNRAGLPYHAEIFSAIKRRNPRAARRAVVGHLEVGERLLGDDLDRPLEEVAKTRLELFFGDDSALVRMPSTLKDLE